MVELFFDLVFVFAITQLSHTLLGDLSARSALLGGPAFSHLLSALAIVSLTSGVVVLVAAWEHVSLRSHTHGVPAAAR